MVKNAARTFGAEKRVFIVFFHKRAFDYSFLFYNLTSSEIYKEVTENGYFFFEYFDEKLANTNEKRTNTNQKKAQKKATQKVA
jgi:hypothetical protein